MAGTTTTSSRSPIGDRTRPMDIEGVQEKESFPPPPTFIDTAALTGFPSPSSAYFSPQDPTLELHHPKPKRARMGTHTSGDASPAFASPSAGSGTHDLSGRPPPASGGSHHQSAAHTRGEKRGMPPSDTSGSEGKVMRRSRPTSDPHGAGSSISSSSAKDKTPTSPSSRGGSRGLHRSSVPPQNGITPIMTSGSADSPHAGYSAPALHTPNQQYNSILDLFPEQKRLSLASDRPAPTSPGPSSRRQSAIAEPPRSVSTNIIPPTPIAAGPPDVGKIDTSLRNGADVVLKIQDFGYAENDARRQYDLTIDLYDPPRPPSPAPPGFIPPMNMDEAEESEASSNFGFIGGGPHSRADEGGGGWLSKDSSSNAEDLDDDQPFSQYDSDPIEFTPGLFRALYPFEPEGSAEMALEEEQEVKCLGRGGGEGWLVAVKEVTTTGEVIHALVPEAYMQLIRPLEDNEVEEAMGKR